jgi:cell division protein FtsZ
VVNAVGGPGAIVTREMQAAGTAPAQQDYATMAVPSVWRNARGQSSTGAAAAAKVDELVRGGMPELDIPAFLRKQAD